MLKNFFRASIAVAVLVCSSAAMAEEEKKLNIYNWSDYILPETIQQFEKETGIKVQYDVYDSNQLLESKLMAGKTGYDIVVPTSSPFLVRQIKLGLYQKINQKELSNYKNLDPKIMKMLAAHDPNNGYSVPWMWGSVGIGYNVKKLKEIMPDAPINSLKVLFDPKVASRFKDCGIGMLDSSVDIVPNALVYAGLDPNSQKPEDLAKAEEVLKAVRPYIRQFHSSKYIDDLANGDLCLVLGFSGDIMQAKTRAEEAKNGVEVGYALPKEGAQVWIDAMAIPADAPHPENAHKFINFVLRPEVVAANSNFIGYANPNVASFKLVDKAIREDKQIYPPEDVLKNMYTLKPTTTTYDRLRTRAWTRILSGK